MALSFLRSRYPSLVIAEFDVKEYAALNEWLAARADVPVEKRLVAPAVFVGDRALIDEQITLDNLEALLARYTTTGAPKIWAMRTIAEMERRNRGPYAGCIGWLGLDKGAVSLDTGITIRSMWIRDGRVSWQAGAGLVYDSVPEKEWQEANNKARVLREVIRGKEDGDVFAHR
jgi:anthranilate synthase component 1